MNTHKELNTIKAQTLTWPASQPKLMLFINISLLIIDSISVLTLCIESDCKIFFIFFNRSNKNSPYLKYIQNIIHNSGHTSIIITANTGTFFNKKKFNLIQKITKGAWKTNFSNRKALLLKYQKVKMVSDGLCTNDLFEYKTHFKPRKIAEMKKNPPPEFTINNLVISAKNDISAIQAPLGTNLLFSIIKILNDNNKYIRKIESYG